MEFLLEYVFPICDNFLSFLSFLLMNLEKKWDLDWQICIVSIICILHTSKLVLNLFSLTGNISLLNSVKLHSWRSKVNEKKSSCFYEIWEHCGVFGNIAAMDFNSFYLLDQRIKEKCLFVGLRLGFLNLTKPIKVDLIASKK